MMIQAYIFSVEAFCKAHYKGPRNGWSKKKGFLLNEVCNGGHKRFSARIKMETSRKKRGKRELRKTGERGRKRTKDDSQIMFKFKDFFCLYTSIGKVIRKYYTVKLFFLKSPKHSTTLHIGSSKSQIRIPAVRSVSLSLAASVFCSHTRAFL